MVHKSTSPLSYSNFVLKVIGTEVHLIGSISLNLYPTTSIILLAVIPGLLVNISMNKIWFWIRKFKISKNLFRKFFHYKNH